jgi:hypothetical protein
MRQEKAERKIPLDNKSIPLKTRAIPIREDVINDLKNLKIPGDTYTDVMRMLINVFDDYSLKKIYEIRLISDEYYRRALAQRRVDRINYFGNRGAKDTGTRPYGTNKELTFKGKVPFFGIQEKDRRKNEARKKEKNKRKYVNKMSFAFDDYDLESIAHLQYLAGISRPQDVILMSIRFAYMVFSQDRLVRNSNAELAEKNLNMMIESSYLDKEPIIPIYSSEFKSVGKDILEFVKESHGPYKGRKIGTQKLIQKLVMDEYNRLVADEEKNEEDGSSE